MTRSSASTPRWARSRIASIEHVEALDRQQAADGEDAQRARRPRGAPVGLHVARSSPWRMVTTLPAASPASRRASTPPNSLARHDPGGRARLLGEADRVVEEVVSVGREPERGAGPGGRAPRRRRSTSARSARGCDRRRKRRSASPARTRAARRRCVPSTRAARAARRRPGKRGRGGAERSRPPGRGRPPTSQGRRRGSRRVASSARASASSTASSRAPQREHPHVVRARGDRELPPDERLGQARPGVQDVAEVHGLDRFRIGRGLQAPSAGTIAATRRGDATAIPC